MARTVIYALDVAAFAAAVWLAVRSRRRPCWAEASMLLPWLVMSLAFSLFLLVRAGLAGGDPPVSHELAWLAGVVRLTGAVSVVLLFRRELCRSG